MSNWPGNMSGKPKPSPPKYLYPWPKRARLWVWAWLRWPFEVRKLRKAGFRKTKDGWWVSP